MTVSLAFAALIFMLTLMSTDIQSQSDNQPDNQSQALIYQVSQLNKTVRTLLEARYPAVWVTGEISNFIQAASGHWYFTLKDSDGQIRCAMFRGANRNVTVTPENGMAVLVQATVSLYPQRGDYQLIVQSCEPAGDGALQQAFERLKKRLAQEGLFNPEHKQALPAWPQRIGVITSPTGAAVRDILKVLSQRWPAIPIVIYPTQVQGKQAAEHVCHALQQANQRRECDVLILARGGGSLEDLWTFNEESVARAVFESNIPIVSGVGHETDTTMVDFVADVRVPTPSAAAAAVVPDRADWQRHLAALLQHLVQHWQRMITQKQYALKLCQQRLQHPGQRLRDYAQRCDLLMQRLQSAWQQQWQQRYLRWQTLTATLEAVSPLATLTRGYAFVQTSEGQLLRTVDDVTVGAQLKVRLSDGALLCDVVGKES